MVIDAWASRYHYQDHCAAVWGALSPPERGTFWVPGRHHAERAEARGVTNVRRGTPSRPGLPCLVASHDDLNALHPGRPAIYLEHGAGQSYAGSPKIAAHPSYSGGHRRRRVALFLCPNETVATREQTANPEARVAIVGCPRLDHLAWRWGERATPWYRPDGPVLALTWHWDAHLCPETRSAWPAWKSMIRAVANIWPGPALGHAHPRLYRQLEPIYASRGIEPVAEIDDVLARADVLTWDNTSAGYEAASLGIPTVVLNAPWYRRSVHHGLRFWDLLPGPVLDSSGDGGEADAEAVTMAAMLAMEPHWRAHSALVAAQVYPPETRGRAGMLAAEAIRALIAEMAA